jgi:hypothetical protein
LATVVCATIDEIPLSSIGGMLPTVTPFQAFQRFKVQGSGPAIRTLQDPSPWSPFFARTCRFVGRRMLRNSHGVVKRAARSVVNNVKYTFAASVTRTGCAITAQTLVALHGIAARICAFQGLYMPCLWFCGERAGRENVCWAPGSVTDSRCCWGPCLIDAGKKAV